MFDDKRIALFGVTVDPQDQSQNRIADDLPGIRFFLDFDLKVSRLYGAAQVALEDGQKLGYRPQWVVLDPMLRILAVAPLSDASTLRDYLKALPNPDLHSGVEAPAPVLLLPRVFERDFCRKLIEQFETGTSEESGFMREQDGKTVQVADYSFKRRRDHHIEDEALREAARARIMRRLLPEIRKAFQFRVTRMERYIVACYDAEVSGHFRPHRDDTTKGTAHRRFAVTINLNAEEYEGGDLRFPEFGSRLYRAPTGGAVVFSCSLLHEATPVTRGRRFAFLPFLYDEAAAKVREANNPYLGEGVGAYQMSDNRI
jgi:predicted 2-oxoglutarate/Fe(II)-dependent dioxygenase YbiX